MVCVVLRDEAPAEEELEALQVHLLVQPGLVLRVAVEQPGLEARRKGPYCTAHILILIKISI